MMHARRCAGCSYNPWHFEAIDLLANSSNSKLIRCQTREEVMLSRLVRHHIVPPAAAAKVASAALAVVVAVASTPSTAAAPRPRRRV